MFLLFKLLTLYPYASYLAQVTIHYVCFEKISFQFLPTDTNWKGGALAESLFILDLGQITVQFHPTMAAFFFLFSLTGIADRLSWNNVSFNLRSLAQV